MTQDSRIPSSESLKKIFYHAHNQASIPQVMRKNVILTEKALEITGNSFPLDSFEKIYVAGAGIASFYMIRHILALLRDRVSQGVVLVPPGYGGQLDRIKVCQVTSPMIDENSYRAMRDLLFITGRAGEKDLVILTLSKGASEALETLHQGISFNDYNTLVKRLAASGADLSEINAIRTHLSMVKGGQLINTIHPATLIVLILSDEPGGDIFRTYQAPTYFDPSTYKFCRQVLIRHKLPLKTPSSILNHFNQGMGGKVPETLKPGDEKLRKVFNFVIHDSASFAADALTGAEGLGFTSSILSTRLEGDAVSLGQFFGAIIKDILEFGIPLESPCVFISAGRLTDSDDNRLENCCRCALSVAKSIDGRARASFMTATSFQYEKKGFVGAVVDGGTIERLRQRGIHAGEVISSGRSSEAMAEMGLVFPASFCPNDCGDLFAIMVEDGRQV